VNKPSPATQPHNDDAELSIVSAVLCHGQDALDLCDGLEPQHFFSEGLRQIYGAALDVAGTGQPCDAVTIGRHLTDSGRAKQIGGVAYLAELRDNMPDRMASLGAYAAIVRDKAALRRLLATCAKISAAAEGETGPVLEFVERAQSQIEAISRDLVDGAGSDEDEVTYLGELTAMGRELQDNKPRQFVTTGIPDLDDDLGGFESGFVSVLGAPTNWGKSGVVAMVCDSALRQGKRVLVVTFEDRPRLYVKRIVCRRGEVSAWRLKHGRLNDADWHGFVQASTDICKAQPEPAFYRAIGKTIETTARRVARMHKRSKYDLIVFDYLQAARSELHLPKRENVDHCLRIMLDVIKGAQYPAAGLIVSQLRRLKPGEEPWLNDLKESGDIEIGAESVLLGFLDGDKSARLRLAKSKDGEKLIDYSLSWNTTSATIFPGSRIEELARKR
jgi:replicative DNA helicase